MPVPPAWANPGAASVWSKKTGARPVTSGRPVPPVKKIVKGRTLTVLPQPGARPAPVVVPAVTNSVGTVVESVSFAAAVQGNKPVVVAVVAVPQAVSEATEAVAPQVAVAVSKSVGAADKTESFVAPGQGKKPTVKSAVDVVGPKETVTCTSVSYAAVTQGKKPAVAVSPKSPESDATKTTVKSVSYAAVAQGQKQAVKTVITLSQVAAPEATETVTESVPSTAAAPPVVQVTSASDAPTRTVNKFFSYAAVAQGKKPVVESAVALPEVLAVSVAAETTTKSAPFAAATALDNQAYVVHVAVPQAAPPVSEATETDTTCVPSATFIQQKPVALAPAAPNAVVEGPAPEQQVPITITTAANAAAAQGNKPVFEAIVAQVVSPKSEVTGSVPAVTVPQIGLVPPVPTGIVFKTESFATAAQGKKLAIMPAVISQTAQPVPAAPGAVVENASFTAADEGKTPVNAPAVAITQVVVAALEAAETIVENGAFATAAQDMKPTALSSQPEALVLQTAMAALKAVKEAADAAAQCEQPAVMPIVGQVVLPVPESIETVGKSFAAAAQNDQETSVTAPELDGGMAKILSFADSGMIDEQGNTLPVKTQAPGLSLPAPPLPAAERDATAQVCANASSKIVDKCAEFDGLDHDVIRVLCLDEYRSQSWWVRIIAFAKRAGRFCAKSFAAPYRLCKKMATRILRKRN